MSRSQLVAVLALTAVAIGACASAPTRYYTLAGVGAANGSVGGSAGGSTGGSTGGSAGGSASESTNGGSARDRKIQIELAQVAVPDRLARPQLVIRQAGDPGTSRVDVLEQSRWTSPFDSELRDAFGAGIASRVDGIDVTNGGRIPGVPVYRIALQLRRFDAVAGRQVDMAFGWSVSGPPVGPPVGPPAGLRATSRARSASPQSAGAQSASPQSGSPQSGSPQSGSPQSGSPQSGSPQSAICERSLNEAVGQNGDTDALVRAIRRIVATIADEIAQQIGQLRSGRAADCSAAP